MTWFKVDDKFGSSTKVVRLPRTSRLACVGLWTLAGQWSAGQLTNGSIPQYMLGELGGTPRLAALLVEVGLWEETPSGWQFHDWSDYQPTREEVEEKRTAARERMKALRNRSRELPANNERTSSEVTQVVRDPRPDPTRPKPELPTEVPSEPRKRGQRLPEGWRPDPEVAVAIRSECPTLDLAAEHLKFSDYWLSKAGQSGTKLDWNATWRNWMREARDRQQNRNHLAPVAASSDWMNR